MASKLQLHQFKVLCALDDVCKAHDIQYALCGQIGSDARVGKALTGSKILVSVAMSKQSFDKFASVSAETGYTLVSNTGKKSTAMLIDENTTLFSFRNPKGFPVPAVGTIIFIAESNGKIATQNGKMVSFSSNEWNNIAMKPVLEREFPALKNADKILNSSYSKNKVIKKLQKMLVPSNAVELIYIPDTSYKIMLERDVFKNGLKVSHKARRWHYWFRRTIADRYTRRTKKYESALRLTGDRFDYWERLYPKKAELLALAADDPTSSQLSEELADFIAAIEKHMKKKLGLTIDSEILEITIPLLKEKHDEKWVEKYLKAIPAPHKAKDISDYLVECGVDHPLL